MGEQAGRVRLPEAFLARMKGLLGGEYEEFLDSYQEDRAQGLRLNPLKVSGGDETEKLVEEFGLRRVAWAREGYYFDSDVRPGKHPFHEAGVFYIQEPSAMAVVELLDPKPGDRVLDLCAAPGGKTTQIAGRLLGKGILVSNEIHPARAKILSQNVERFGIGSAVVTNEEPGSLARRFPGFFDKILVDAPCSGEGMFRKDQEAREQWSPENVVMCARRQGEVLDQAAKMLRPGGRLVYSTCTFAPEENEGSISGFLRRNPEFSVEKVFMEQAEERGESGEQRKIGEWREAEEQREPKERGESEERKYAENGRAGDQPGAVQDQSAGKGLDHGHPEWIQDGQEELRYTFRIWPHRVQGEGHYAAVLRKAGEDEQGDSHGRKKQKMPSYVKDKQVLKLWRTFAEETFTQEGLCTFDKDMENHLVLFGEQLYQIPGEMPDYQGLRVLRAGLHLGTVKKNRFEPSHGLALYLKKEQVKRWESREADGLDMKAYLRGETLRARESQEGGWVLMLAGEYSIGWAKQVGETLKNHYPKGLRKL